MNLRITSITISLVVLLGFAGIWLYSGEFPGIEGIVIFASPSFISLILAMKCRYPDSLKIVATVSRIHGVCFVFIVAGILVSVLEEPLKTYLFLGSLIFFALYLLIILPILLVMLIWVAFREIYQRFNKETPSSE